MNGGTELCIVSVPANARIRVDSLGVTITALRLARLHAARYTKRKALLPSSMVLAKRLTLPKLQPTPDVRYVRHGWILTSGPLMKEIKYRISLCPI